MLAETQWAAIFGAAKRRGARWPDNADVIAFKAEVTSALGLVPPVSFGVADAVKPAGRTVGPRAIALMHEFETCKLTAYPDPGSKDGTPWTIGWGSTGPGIVQGTVWSQAQADARYAHDVNAVYGAAVDTLLGDTPTTQSQFDAMVCLAYNIGVGSANPAKKGGFTRSSVLRLHKARDYPDAARAFLLWNQNDGKVMRGLTRRRLAEADLYDDDGVPT